MYGTQKKYFDFMTALGLPKINPFGTVFYVDPVSGLDTNDGKSPATALKSLTAAYTALTANKNDTLVYVGNDAATASLAATLDWAKDYTHLVGACSPVALGQRARIFGHADNALTPLIKISAKGCSFRNIHVNYGVAHAESLVAVEVTGSRNYFENCHFAGIGHATQDAADACSLKLNGCTENMFKHCAIGLDTQHARGALSSEILTIANTSKMFFEDCYIYAWISAGGHSLLKVASKGLAGTWVFKNCTFTSISENYLVTMDSVINFTTGDLETAQVILQNCCAAGYITAWDANNRQYLYLLA